MRYLLYFFLILGIHNAQVTGLNGWDLFIDPGHSQDENMGINGYSEAKEVLQVGLELMDTLSKKLTIPLHNNFALQVSSINRFQYMV